MDQIPLAFCERICEILLPDGIWATRELSGHYGEIACARFRHDCDYQIDVEDGIEQQVHSYLTHTGEDVQAPEEVEAVTKKFVRRVRISLSDTKKESVSKSMEIVRRFPFSAYCLALCSSSINEAWVDFACSLKRLHCLAITNKLDNDSLRLFQKLIAGRKLSRLMMFSTACKDGNLEMLKTLLCQDQFKELRIRKYAGRWKHVDGAAVGELLQFWSENGGEPMKGKSLFVDRCFGGVWQFEQFVLQGVSTADLGGLKKALQICSKEECDFLNREYYLNHVAYTKPSCIYKYEDAREGIGRRRIYVSFECATQEELSSSGRHFPAGQDGHNDLCLLRSTTYLHIFFA
uniref:F-box domain-containing protein n=1 Tax=Steinernema glaseri TaxID=37863 RepID=A0A1I7Y007_9BILA